VLVPELKGTPVVIDLCGYEPDPQRLPDDAVQREGEFVQFDLA
jgi:hypothetical protein